MNESDLARIEASLGVSLSQDYRELMLSRGEELKDIGERHPFFAESLFLEADQLIGSNQSEREPDMGTAYAFPKWWKKFVLVGTNGGGDYYCVRLDGDQHVWMIGSDCGSRPKKKFESFAEYVEATIQSYENPEPLPSSFDESCPLINRFQIALWDDRCMITPQEGDLPLTSEKLQSHGIAAADIETCVKSMIAALANNSPEAVQINDPPPSHNGEFVVGLKAPSYNDPRLLRARVDIFRGYIKVEFLLTQERSEKTPAPRKLQVDWPAFQQTVVRLLELLHPAGTRVTLTKPQPERGETGPRYAWIYTLDYSLR